MKINHFYVLTVLYTTNFKRYFILVIQRFSTAYIKNYDDRLLVLVEKFKKFKLCCGNIK